VVSLRGRRASDEFEAMILAQHDLLLARAHRLAGTVEAAHDLVQDTIERALRRRDSFVVGTSVRGWLLTILSNRFIDQMRRRQVVREEAIGDHDVAVDAPTTELPVTADQLRAAVAALPSELREVVTLHDLEGKSYRDIAAALGVPMGTIGTRLARARTKLYQALRAEAPR